MMEREKLPEKRYCENFDVNVPGLKEPVVVTVGYYPDGRMAEVFVSQAKAGSSIDAVTRDAAIILSIAMQYGLPPSAFHGAMTRELNGELSTAIGVLVERLAEEERSKP